MVKRKIAPEVQLSLFEQSDPEAPVPGIEEFAHSRRKNTQPEKDPSVIDFIKARYEHGPEMTAEEYKRWIKILVNASIKRLE